MAVAVAVRVTGHIMPAEALTDTRATQLLTMPRMSTQAMLPKTAGPSQTRKMRNENENENENGKKKKRK